MATSQLIFQSYDITDLNDQVNRAAYKDKVEQLLKYNKAMKGTDFLTPLNFHLSRLDDFDKVMIPFMNKEKKNQLLRDLQATYLLLLAQQKYELTHQKSEFEEQYNNQLSQCEQLIDCLMDNPPSRAEEPKPALERTAGRHVAYLGLFLGREFAQDMMEITEGATKKIKDNLGWFNEKRLYWIWSSSLINTVLGLLPDDFFNTLQAKKAVQAPNVYTGYTSWILYYFRFSLHLGLLLKHTIAGPWMSEEEKNPGTWNRFKTQWQMRKFSLINDSFWATGNLIYFFRLLGPGAGGDALTLALLFLDITIAVWDFAEQETAFNKEMDHYVLRIKSTKEIIAEHKKQEQQITDNETQLLVNRSDDAQEIIDEQKKQKKLIQQQIAEYEMRLHTLERAKRQDQRKWDYQKITLATNISYAVGLVIAFALLTTPFFPFAAGALLSMSIAGAVLCFAFSVIANGIKGGIEIHKQKAVLKELNADLNLKIGQFIQFKEAKKDLNSAEMKLLYLEIKKLTCDNEYQKKMINWQTMQVIRSVMLEALIPAIIFTSLVFLPLGVGLGALAAVIGLAIASHYLIEGVFKPPKVELAAFNQEEFDTFCNNPNQLLPKQIQGPGLFDRSSPKSTQQSNNRESDTLAKGHHAPS